MILWCSELLGDYNFPYPSSSGTIAYNIVSRLLERKMDVAVADPLSQRHRSVMSMSSKALGRLYATYGNRDTIDLVSRLVPEKVVTDSLQLANMLTAIPKCPDIVLLARSSEIERIDAEVLTIVSVSNTMQDELNKRGIDSTYIPLGVDSSIFKKIERNKKGFVFGCVCRNKGEKNLYTLMQAYKLFNDNFRDAAALAIHADNGVWDVRRIAKKLDIKDNVFFGNWPADLSNMTRVYNTFDVHINIGGKEWSALPVIESMATQTPQIVSDYGVLQEYADGCGILVHAKDYYTQIGEMKIVDPEDVARAMEKLWINEQERTKAGENALKKARTYSWDVSAKLWEGLLLESQ